MSVTHSANKNQPPTQRKWHIPVLNWVTEICPVCGRPYERKKGSRQKTCKDINCQLVWKINKDEAITHTNGHSLHVRSALAMACTGAYCEPKKHDKPHMIL